MTCSFLPSLLDFCAFTLQRQPVSKQQLDRQILQHQVLLLAVCFPPSILLSAYPKEIH
jgi:hypothetical protein